jgi:hypothetical protein
MNFHCAIGRCFPNLDPWAFNIRALVELLIQRERLPIPDACDIEFHLGTFPDSRGDRWRKKLARLKDFQDVKPVTSGNLIEASPCRCPQGHCITQCPRCDGIPRKPREKGVDVRIALNALHGMNSGIYSALVMFSQDNDLAPALRDIAKSFLNRGWIYRLYSAFPVCDSADPRHGRIHKGINTAKKMPYFYNDYEQTATDHY